MPRKLLVALALGVVVLGSTLLLPWPLDARAARHNLARAVVWIALLAALPSPRTGRFVQALALLALAVSLGDAVDAASQLEFAAVSEGSALRLVRGLLGLAAASLILWSHTRVDVLAWRGGASSPPAAADPPDARRQ